jgi:hypothetical protein
MDARLVITHDLTINLSAKLDFFQAESISDSRTLRIKLYPKILRFCVADTIYGVGKIIRY